MWEEDGLDVNISQPFLRESFPRINTEGKKVLQNFLNRHERIKNPTPDRVYGVAEDAFTEEENTVNNMYNKFAGLSPGLYHVGLIFEFGRDKSMEEVEAQCARGGAAAVHAARETRLAAEENIMQDGADLACVIYSFAVTPSVAHLSIHWAEIFRKRISFHMHYFQAYTLGEIEKILTMRRDLNNLLDWIFGDRKHWIKRMLKKIDAKVSSSGPVGATT